MREWRNKLGGEVKFLRAYRLAMIVCHGRVQSIVLASDLNPRENGFRGIVPLLRIGSSIVPRKPPAFKQALTGQSANLLRFQS